MAFPYKKILFPFDFDENSMAALDRAVEIAKQLSSTIILVHVVPLVLPLGAIPPPVGLYEEQEADAQGGSLISQNKNSAVSNTSPTPILAT